MRSPPWRPLLWPVGAWSGIHAVVVTFAGITFGAVVTFEQPYVLALGGIEVRSFFVAFAAAAILIRLCCGHMPDRLGRHRVAVVSLSLYAAATVAMAGLRPASAPFLGRWFGLAHGMFYPSMNAIAVSAVRPEERGRIMAIFTGAFSLGVWLGTTGLGIVAASSGYAAVFVVAASGAAVTATALLGVVEPFSTGIGGDCFMLVWSARDQRLFGLNGSGRAPRQATVEALRAAGHATMPMLGMAAVTVPGAVDAWACALERFGTRSLADALAPAIEYAADGFPASEVVSAQWAFAAGLLQTPGGRAAFAPPRVGAVTRVPELADSLSQIAAGGPEVLYRGELAAQIVAFSQAHGGLLEAADLAEHASQWVEPIATTYRGYTVHEMPPNGQGLAVLLALNILEEFDIAAVDDPVAATHLRIEAVKLAYADRNRYLADPEMALVPTEALLAKSYARERAALIRRDAMVVDVGPGEPLAGSDTVYLTTADAEGNVVSCINSLFFPFGSGMVVDGTGIALQNRAFGFSLDPAHPNCIAPRKRPFHTIIPAMICRDDRPVVSFGVMGGNVQAQAHAQVVSQLLDHGANVQEALDAPRFHYLDGCRVAVEATFGTDVRRALGALGHEVEGEAAAIRYGGFGGG